MIHAHVVGWMTPSEEGVRPHQLQKMLMHVPQDCELSESFVLSANNSTAYILFDLAALEDMGIELDQAKADVSQTLLPVLEDWENESDDCFYISPGIGLRIFMGCDVPTEQLDGKTTGVLKESCVAVTFRELRDALNALSDEQLDTSLTVYDGEDDEFHSVSASIHRTVEEEVLDRNHPYLQFFSSVGEAVDCQSE